MGDALKTGARMPDASGVARQCTGIGRRAICTVSLAEAGRYAVAHALHGPSVSSQLPSSHMAAVAELPRADQSLSSFPPPPPRHHSVVQMIYLLPSVKITCTILVEPVGGQLADL